MNSKAKGSSFEREICSYLTNWLTGQTKEKYFWRTAASGGIATITQCNNHLAGDITSIKPESKFFTDLFVIECKVGYRTACFYKLLNGAKDPVRDFWKQVVGDSDKSGKYPLLIFKRTGLKPLVGFPVAFASDIFLDLTESLWLTVVIDRNHKYGKFIFMGMDDFFNLVTPQLLRGDHE